MVKNKKNEQSLFWIIGFLIGVIYIMLTEQNTGGSMNLINIQNLIQVQYANIEYRDYFCFLIIKRMKIFLLMLVSAMALPGRHILSAMLGVCGLGAGTLLSMLVVRFGIKGVVLFLGLLFPQNIVYIPMLLWGVKCLTEWNTGLFDKMGTWSRRRGEGMFRSMQILIMLGVTIMGVCLECYVNPFIVKVCLKIF